MKNPDHKSILAPVQKNDGCSFFRIETPARYLGDWKIDMPQYKFNKFRSPQSGVKIIDRVAGSVWDRAKKYERKKMAERQSDYDAFWLSRSMLSFDNAVDRGMKDLIYDIDDAVWLNGEANHCFEHHCSNALVVFAGNRFVADHASRYTKRVEVVPTSVDLTYHKHLGANKETFNVGWIGSAAGLRYLSDISSQLQIFFERHSDARLIIVTERFPHELTPLQKYIRYIPWTRDTEIASLNQFSVGIMPLHDTDWEKAKCSFKMLQYMGCEIPCIVSPVGMNLEVIAHGSNNGTFGRVTENWTEVLDAYYLMAESDRRLQGQHGRAVVEKHYSTKVIASMIDGFMKKYVGGK